MPGSTRVIYTALFGNVTIAVAKLLAFLLSGSSAMLTEAVHSFVVAVMVMLAGGRAPLDCQTIAAITTVGRRGHEPGTSVGCHSNIHGIIGTAASDGLRRSATQQARIGSYRSPPPS